MANALRNAINRRARQWARRRQGEDSIPVTLARNRVYILPTRFGAIYAALVFTMLLASMNYNNSLGFALTFLLTGLALVSMYHCHRNLMSAVVSGVHGGETFAGDPLRLQVGIENPTALERYELEIQCSGRRATIHRIEPASRALIDLDLPPQKRGVWRPHRISITTRFPFGLFRAWSWVHLPVEVLVYPKPSGEQSPPMAAAAGGTYETQSAMRTGSEDFRGFRSYSPGDSPRHIAWKALARSGTLLVKEYSDAGEAPTIYDFDSIQARGIEARLSQLCRWILQADRRSVAFGLKLPGKFIPVASGAQHRQQCLAALALFAANE